MFLSVRGQEGDAHPVGALAIGTTIHCVETMPGKGAEFGVQAGGGLTITRRHEGLVVVQVFQTYIWHHIENAFECALLLQYVRCVVCCFEILVCQSDPILLVLGQFLCSEKD